MIYKNNTPHGFVFMQPNLVCGTAYEYEVRPGDVVVKLKNESITDDTPYIRHSFYTSDIFGIMRDEESYLFADVASRTQASYWTNQIDSLAKQEYESTGSVNGALYFTCEGKVIWISDYDIKVFTVIG